MAENFPFFLDISNKKIVVYGAGRIASRRVETLLAFHPLLLVYAPEASDRILQAAEEKKVFYYKESFHPGDIPDDAFVVLAATDDASVNETIYEECREKKIPVNVCSNRNHCDFQFPGIARKGDLVIGINAGGNDHHLAKRWTDKIRREVEEDE
jgi:siroheme synthase-like protein